MEGLFENLDRFISQMNAIKKYISSIDEIMDTTFRMKITEIKDGRAIVYAYIMLDHWYELLKEDEQSFLREINRFIQKTEKRFLKKKDINELQIGNLFTIILERFSNEEKGVTFYIDKENELSFKIRDNKIAKELNIYINKSIEEDRQQELLYETSLISLSNAFEALFYKMTAFLITNTRNSKIEEKQLTYKQMIDLGGIEEAKEYLIEKAVEEVMRGTQISWLEHLAKNTSKKFFEELVGEEEKQFNEFFLRRNLIIHNEGRVNKKYVNACNQKEISSPFGIGEKIVLSTNYLLSNLNLLFVIAVKANYYVVKSYFPKNFQKFFDHYHSIAFDQLLSEEYEIAYVVLEMLFKDSNHFSEKQKLMLVINYLQSLKWTNREQRLTDLLERTDFSLADNEHKLCLALIQDNFEEAVTYLDELLQKEKMDSGNDSDLLNLYMEWPIFKEFCKTEILLTYLAKHNYKDVKVTSKIIEEEIEVCDNEGETDSNRQ
ncbi:hypothetical protein [Enterococcus faecalis]|uniref:hypothetical protein n=1 Tax=Enterococcus faecalis TaxID=1351 RepID=UPI002936AB7D|nr:hypothetical protein [Enterococcus faecalis]MDV2933817.1 hypothetical protein [Enterococcus faecalis]